jgi:hypothetical protein
MSLAVDEVGEGEEEKNWVDSAIFFELTSSQMALPGVSMMLFPSSLYFKGTSRLVGRLIT